MTPATIFNISPPMFKLTVHCFHEIFDWLSLRDLIAVGQACKHLQRIAGEFVYYNYAAKMLRGDENGIYISSERSNVFSQYIQKLSISGDRLKAYQFVAMNCTNSIKHFRAYGTLPEGAFECIKDILKGIEVLEMNDCVINGEFYENYLKYCPNIKSLSISRSGRIRNSSVIIGTGNEWMFRTYPKLENLELVELNQLNNNELKILFQQNPNIRTFSTDLRTLCDNRYSIMEMNTKLDRLAVDVHWTKVVGSNNEPTSMVDLLREMHEKGIYNRLHLYMLFGFVGEVFTLNGIEMVIGDIVRIDHVMYGVRAAAFWCGDEIENIEQLPFKCPNLKRVYFSKLTSDRLAPSIRHSPHLKQIRIRQVNDEVNFKSLDLAKLNEERKKLIGAQKVAIYIKEDVYLPTKWTWNTIDFSHVELGRYDSTEWEELNSRAKYLKSF